MVDLVRVRPATAVRGVIEHEDDVAQLELCEKAVEVRGESVVVVSDAWLARVPKAAAVVGDNAKASVQERRDLLLPRAAAEREAMDPHDRPPTPNVVVMNLDGRGVRIADVDVRHCVSFVGWGWRRERRCAAGCSNHATRSRRPQDRWQP